MKKYSWKFIINADAQKVGKELEKIETLGELNNEAVLKYAEEHPKSELYKCFDWDDTEASKKWRLNQASRIICSISVEIKEEPTVKQRIYVNVRSSETGKRKFKNIRDVLENDDEYNQLVNKAKEDFNKCKEKYDTIINRDDLKDILFDIYREI